MANLRKGKLSKKWNEEKREIGGKVSLWNLKKGNLEKDHLGKREMWSGKKGELGEEKLGKGENWKKKNWEKGN